MGINNSPFSGYEIPVKKENECLIISNAIQDSKNREMFLKKVNYLDFRLPEFQTIAWAIKKSHEEQMDIDVEAVLLNSSKAPIKYLVTNELLSNLIGNYKVVSSINYDKHLKELKIDSIKSKILNSTFEHLYKICLDPSAEMGEVEKRVDYLKDIIKTGYSSSILEFKSMDELLKEYNESLGRSSSFRPTGFREIDATTIS